MIYVFDRIQNIVEKGENAGYQHFLLFPQYFQKFLYLRVAKSGDCGKVLIRYVHTNAGLDNNRIVFFSLTSQDLLFIKVMAGFDYTVGEMNVMLTVVCLSKIVLVDGGSVLVWACIARGFRINLVVIEENMNSQRYRDEIHARHVIPLFQNNANITLFQHYNATSHTARDTENFLRANCIAFIYD